MRDDKRTAAYADLIREYFDAGRPEEVVELAEASPGSAVGPPLPEADAVAHARLGHVARAKELLTRMAIHPPQVFEAIAAAEIRAGHFDELNEWARALPDPFDRFYVDLAAAEALMQSVKKNQ